MKLSFNYSTFSSKTILYSLVVLAGWGNVVSKASSASKILFSNENMMAKQLQLALMTQSMTNDTTELEKKLKKREDQIITEVSATAFNNLKKNLGLKNNSLLVRLVDFSGDVILSFYSLARSFVSGTVFGRDLMIKVFGEEPRMFWKMADLILWIFKLNQGSQHLEEKAQKSIFKTQMQAIQSNLLLSQLQHYQLKNQKLAKELGLKKEKDSNEK